MVRSPKTSVVVSSARSPAPSRRRTGVKEARRSSERIRATSTALSHGLDDIVVGARLQAGHDVEGVAARGHHQDRRQAQFADPAAQPDAVELGQHDVEQQQVRAPLAEELQPGQSVGRGGDGEAVALQQHPDGVADHLVVLDEQQMRLGGAAGRGEGGCRRRYRGHRGVLVGGLVASAARGRTRPVPVPVPVLGPVWARCRVAAWSCGTPAVITAPFHR